MGTPFLSEIKIISFNFPPKGWAFCNGQLMAINQNQALFALLGTTYGGNGQTTFALPNLQARLPIHTGSGHNLGSTGGETTHTVTISELPTHIHTASGSSTAGDVATPSAHLLASSPALVYSGPTNLVGLQPGTVGNAGGSQPHNNLMPYLVLNFIIALQGIFPSQN